jgi:hypothetical protein
MRNKRWFHEPATSVASSGEDGDRSTGSGQIAVVAVPMATLKNARRSLAVDGGFAGWVESEG